MNYHITLTVSQQTDTGETILYQDKVLFPAIGEIIEPWADCQRILEQASPIYGGLHRKETVR